MKILSEYRITRFFPFVSIIALLFFSLSSPCQLTGVHIYNVPASNGTVQINCLVKTSNGYLLLGTTSGLYRFDGKNFKGYTYSQQLKSRSVTAIGEDRNHIIWLGFQDGEIALLRNQNVEMLQAEEGHPVVAVTSILPQQKEIYFATAGEGIYYYTGRRFYNINTDDGLSDNYVYNMLPVGNGLLASTDRGLNAIEIKDNKKSIVKYTSADGLPDNIVRCVFPGRPQTRYWIGMQDRGVASFSPKQLQQFSLLDTAWQLGQINSLTATDNQLWMATDQDGIIIKQYADNEMTRLISSLSYNNGYAKANNLLTDDEGNVWFTSQDKLIKTNGAHIQNIIPYTESVYNQVHTILKDRDGQLWINTETGLLRYVFNQNKQLWQGKNISITGIDARTDITCLYQHDDGFLWAGTIGKGIILVDPSTGTSKPLDEPLLRGGSILSISSHGNDIWISTLSGVVRASRNSNRKGGCSFSSFADVNSIGSNYIYRIYPDSKNRVWFGTDGRGLVMYDNKGFTVYNHANGIKSLVIYNICEDKNGNIWFSALNDGLYKFDGNDFVHLGVSNGLNDATITSLACDERNNILAITSKGINIIDATKLSVSYVDDDQEVEQINTDLNCISGDGALYFVTNKGIMRYQPTALTLKPKIVLDGVELFLKNIDYRQRHVFNYDENNLTFAFTGISLSHPTRIRYQYQLAGVSNEWITTNDERIYFPKLAPGEYTFRVKASLNNNFSNANEVSYKFTIGKPFWLQWWFILFMVLTITGGVYLLIKLRVRSVKRLERLEKEKIQSQFEVLKSQVNPHFLFNSFNTLISVIEEDSDRAVEYVEHLSDLYRKIVIYRDKDVISLKEEFSLIDHYFFIQKKRFGDYLTCKNGFTLQEQRQYMIAPLTLQLLVENAIKHNAISKDTHLLIEFLREGDYLVVRNNINPKIVTDSGAGMGLQNIEKRYKLLSNNDVLIKKGGESFIVKIPLLKTQL